MVSVDTLMGKRGLQVMHLNVRSLKANYPRLLVELRNTKLDIMCFTESWLRDKHNSQDVMFDGYTLHRVDRAWIDPRVGIDEDGEPKTGGGVCVYVKSCIQHDAYDLAYLKQKLSKY